MSSKLSNLSVIVCAATASLFVSGCSQDGGTTPHPDAEAINGYVDGLPYYELREQTAAAPVDLGPTFAMSIEDGWELDYRCEAQQDELVLETVEIGGSNPLAPPCP